MSLIYESFFFFCASNQNFDFRVLFHQIHNAHDCIDPFFTRSNPNVNSCPIYGCCFFQKTIINFINKIGVSRVGSSFWPIYYYICVFDQIIQSSPKFIVHTLILFMLNSFWLCAKKVAPQHQGSYVPFVHQSPPGPIEPLQRKELRRLAVFCTERLGPCTPPNFFYSAAFNNCRVYSSFGCSKISATVPRSTMRPCFITSTRSQS